MDNTTLIKNFLDIEGKIKSYPAKQSKLIAVLKYLSNAFIKDTLYSESEVNDIISSKITFSDYVTLRRDLIDFGFLSRTKDGKIYSLIPQNE